MASLTESLEFLKLEREALQTKLKHLNDLIRMLEDANMRGMLQDFND